MLQGSLDHLSWFWIGAELIVPPLLALFAALLLWRRDQTIFGNIVGTGLIFASAFGLILREYVQIQRLTGACLDAGSLCWPEPPAFTRFAIYSGIGLAEIFVVFYVSVLFEERKRRRRYAPEWR